MKKIKKSEGCIILGTSKEIQTMYLFYFVTGKAIPSHCEEAKFNPSKKYSLVLDYYDLDGHYLETPSMMVCGEEVTTKFWNDLVIKPFLDELLEEVTL